MQPNLAAKYGIEADELSREVRSIALFLVENYKKGSASGFLAALDLLKNGDLPKGEKPKIIYRVGLVFETGIFSNDIEFTDKAVAEKVKARAEKVVPPGVRVEIIEERTDERK